MLGRGIVEQHHLTVGDKLDLLVKFRNGRIDINRVVDATLLIHLPVVHRQLVGEQNDVDILAFLLNICDSCDIFCLYTLLVEHNEMFITNMGGTGRGTILVVGRKLNQPPGNVFQTFLGFGVVAKINYTYHILYNNV